MSGGQLLSLIEAMIKPNQTFIIAHGTICLLTDERGQDNKGS